MPMLPFKVTATCCQTPVGKVVVVLICCSPVLLARVSAKRR